MSEKNLEFNLFQIVIFIIVVVIRRRRAFSLETTVPRINRRASDESWLDPDSPELTGVGLSIWRARCISFHASAIASVQDRRHG